MLDIIIKNGRLVDGTGNPWFKTDIGIRDMKIQRVGNLSKVDAKKVIDAQGLFVASGFIDMHSHSDHVLLVDGRAESKIMQGVTTEVIGNCGSSAAPLSDASLELVKAGMRSFLEESGLTIDWRTMDEYLTRLERQGTSVNVAPLVGHGRIRMAVMGMEDREPIKSELEEMKRYLKEAMESGAFGMSTGLIYPPGVYAKTEEIIELAKVVAEYGGVYASHTRGAGETMMDAVKEAIEIGDKAKVSVQVSHLKAAGKRNWGKVKDALEMMEEWKDKVEVTCDAYPYTASSFGLAAMLPPWMRGGGNEKLVDRLKDPEVRKKMKKQMMEGISGWSSPLRQAGWEDTMISRSSRMEEIEGLSMKEASKKYGKDPFEFAFDLLIKEKGGGRVIRFTMDEKDVITALSHPLSMIGSDGRAVSPHGVLGKGKPHPRYYGTFPRVISRYVKQKKALTLEDAVRKMTSLPARKLGLWDRGLIKPRMRADIVIFNYNTIQDTATFSDPHKFPKGIECVIVNGSVTVDKGEHTGALPGTVLRKNRL